MLRSFDADHSPVADSPLAWEFAPTASAWLRWRARVPEAHALLMRTPLAPVCASFVACSVRLEQADSIRQASLPDADAFDRPAVRA